MSLFLTSLTKTISKDISLITVCHKNRQTFVIGISQQFKYVKTFSNSANHRQNYQQANERFQNFNSLKNWAPYGLFAVGLVGYGTYLYNSNTAVFNKATPDMSSAEEYFLKEAPPKPPIARSIQSSLDKTGLKITLYQYQTCPFCCKVRAFLDYSGFSYDVVEVNSVSRKETKWTIYRKVPFIVVERPDSEVFLQLKDSSMIISALQSYLLNKTQTIEEIAKCYPIEYYIDVDEKKKTRILNRFFIMYGLNTEVLEDKIMSERKWRRWIDDVFVHTLSPNIYRTMNESLQAFQHFSKVGNWEEHFSTFERLLAIYVGSLAMYFIGKKLKKRHGLKDDVRESLYYETNKWIKEVRKHGGKFMGGAKPNLSDLGVYGVLSAIEGCDAFDDLLANTKIKDWYMSMKEAVESHAGAVYIEQRTQ